MRQDPGRLPGARRHLWLAASVLLVLSIPTAAAGQPNAGEQEEVPPPVPPAPQQATPGSEPAPPAKNPAEPPREPTGLERYQECFQKMIDAGSTDQDFMRRCLGLGERPRKGRRPGEPVAVLTVEDVRRVTDAGLPALKDCYAQLLHGTRALGVTPQGPVYIRFEINPAGKVEAFSYETGTLTDAGMLACMREKIMTWAFPKADWEDPARVRLEFRLSAGPRRTPVIATAKGSPAVDTPGVGLAPEDIMAVFRRNAPSLRACYDDWRGRAKSAEGEVLAEVEVAASGRVGGVQIKKSSAGDPAFRACLVKRLKSWKFPRPAAGQPVKVKFPPLVFKPG